MADEEETFAAAMGGVYFAVWLGEDDVGNGVVNGELFPLQLQPQPQDVVVSDFEVQLAHLCGADAQQLFGAVEEAMVAGAAWVFEQQLCAVVG